MEMNSISITGNLGRDPESFEYGEPPRQAVRLTIASTENSVRFSHNEIRNEVRKGARERTSWITAILFGPLGTNALKSLRKGDHVIAVGEMSVRSWQDAGTGEWQTRAQLVAEEVGLSLNFLSVRPTSQAAEEVVPEPPAEVTEPAAPAPPVLDAAPKPPKARASRAKKEVSVPQGQDEAPF
jgi:single-strand DNA-binding protein